MANGAGSSEKALEELIRRVIREEMAATSVPGKAMATPAVPAPTSGPGMGAASQAVSGILQPTGQSDIMAAALRGALALAGRCVLLVRRGENFSAWRSEGYSGNTAGALRAVSVSASQPGIFKNLCDTLQPICRPRSAGVLPAPLEQALGSAAGPHLCLLPILVQGKVVAALYSDAGGRSGSEEMSGLEILARVTGLSLETAAARAAAGGEAGRPAASAAPAPAAEAAPEPVALETPVAAEAAPSPGSFAAGFPVAAEGEAVLPPPPDMESMPEAERDSHKKAYRFARVAVQDLLSYHKDKIEQGRRNKNLFTLLKEDIEKTRENYQKRFGQTPARSFDYLHYEMVAKLAGNDLSVLGDQYPGPVSNE